MDQTAKLLGFGQDEDRINCPFYLKIGACRNGDRCNRSHNKPEKSNTLLLSHMYPNSPEGVAIANDEEWDDEMYDRAQDHVEAFYEEVFLELAKYGEVEDIVVLENVGEHMLGHVYAKYYREEAAARALKELHNRFFGDRLILGELTNVTDFRESRCRAFHETRCTRGGYCNFMHIKHIPKAVKRRIVRTMYKEHPDFAHNPETQYKPPPPPPPAWENPANKEAASRSRSRSPKGVVKEEAKDKPEDKAKEALAVVPAVSTKPKRQTSEERRAMIKQWNLELKAAQAAAPAAPN